MHGCRKDMEYKLIVKKLILTYVFIIQVIGDMNAFLEEGLFIKNRDALCHIFKDDNMVRL